MKGVKLTTILDIRTKFSLLPQKEVMPIHSFISIAFSSLNRHLLDEEFEW